MFGYLFIFLQKSLLGEVAKTRFWVVSDRQRRGKVAVASRAGSEAGWHPSGTTRWTPRTRKAFRTDRTHPVEGNPGCRAELTDSSESEFFGRRIRSLQFRYLGCFEKPHRVGWPTSGEGSKVRRLRRPWSCISSRGTGWWSGGGPWRMESPKIRFEMEVQPNERKIKIIKRIRRQLEVLDSKK